MMLPEDKLKRIFSNIDLSRIYDTKVNNIWVFIVRSGKAIFEMGLKKVGNRYVYQANGSIDTKTVNATVLLTVLTITKVNHMYEELDADDIYQHVESIQLPDIRYLFRQMNISYPNLEDSNQQLFERLVVILSVDLSYSEENYYAKAFFYDKLSELIALCFKKRYAGVLAKILKENNGNINDVSPFLDFSICCQRILNGNYGSPCEIVT